MSEVNKSFHELSPDLILMAAEAAGFRATGETIQLNSYENRVFDVGIEGDTASQGTSSGAQSEYTSRNGLRSSVIVKFYRPGRWTAACILEEHQFVQELVEKDLHAAPALPLREHRVQLHRQQTLGILQNLYFAVFPKIRGRLPDELRIPQLESLGRTLAQLHNIGAQSKFHQRPYLNRSPFTLWDHLTLLEAWVAPEVWHRYEDAAVEIIDAYENQIDERAFIRIHGDFHRGNTLLESGPSGELTSFRLVDFDDCAMGPAVQDLWMLYSSETGSTDWDAENTAITKGYSEFRVFPTQQLAWIPLLRGARIISYAAWVARRWTDPSFPRLFPDFKSYKNWCVETEALEKIMYQIKI